MPESERDHCQLMLLRLPSGSVSEAVALMPCSRLTGLITSRPGSSTLRTLTVICTVSSTVWLVWGLPSSSSRSVTLRTRE